MNKTHYADYCYGDLVKERDEVLRPLFNKMLLAKTKRNMREVSEIEKQIKRVRANYSFLEIRQF